MNIQGFDSFEKTCSYETDNSMMLEPRLQEYIKKKKYYKKNKIKPCVEPEKEFQITDRDRRLLRDFISNGKDMYRTDVAKLDDGYKDKRHNYFPSKSFRKDVPNKKFSDRPVNRGMFYPDDDTAYYDEDAPPSRLIGDSRDFCKGSGFNIDNTRFDPRNDAKINSGVEKYNKYSSQYRVDPTSNSKICYSNLDNKIVADNYRLIDDTVENILEKRNRYGTRSEAQFSDKSDMDLKSKVVVPKISVKSKSCSTSDYRLMQFPHDDNVDELDMLIENDMIRGMPTRTLKSYGYRNPDEHYYQYVDDEFQNSSLPFPRGGVSTRRENKKMAKQGYHREIV